MDVELTRPSREELDYIEDEEWHASRVGLWDESDEDELAAERFEEWIFEDWPDYSERHEGEACIVWY